MRTNNDHVLDTLSLAIYSKDPSDIALVHQVISMHSQYSKLQADKLSNFYISLLKAILNDDYDLNDESEINRLFLKFSHSPIIMRDVSTLDNLKKMFKSRGKVSDAVLQKIRAKVRNWIIWMNTAESAKKMMQKLQKIPIQSDISTQELLLQEVLENARDIPKFYETAQLGDSTVDFIDMSDKSSVMSAVKSHKYTRKDDNVFKLGLKGLNNMFYPNNGILRGESVAFAASSHNYKSGMLMSAARWIATLNPTPEVPGMPAIVFISLENEIYENMNQWFKEAYINATHTSPKNLSDEEIVEYVTNMYAKNGYKLLVFRKLGDLFGFEEYVALIEQLESDGYTVVASIIDYITLMRLPANSRENTAKALQKMASSIFQYGKHKLITTVTGLQLDTEAERLNDSGFTYIVKRYGTSNLADCKGLLRELDFLAFLYIEENHLGFKYLTAAWKKHRYVNGIPSKYKYPAWKFHEELGILDDVDSDQDTTVYDIYAEQLEEVSVSDLEII